ncbi:MAG: response regulator [FCB group bacterium]|nr:response regulator [FCB group bacterium]
MKKILIVDDQMEVRELIHVTLRSSNYELLQAENGPQALEIARKELPDLILLDVMMPQGGIDGFEVCETLKKEPNTRKIHIVMLTAIQQEVDLERGRRAGADDYFTKPFSPLKLLQKVSDILGDPQ